MNRRLEGVRIASLRVALISTAVLAAGYAIVATIVLVLVTHNLTAQVDERLLNSLTRVESGQLPAIPVGVLRTPSDSRFGPPLLAWVMTPEGNVFASDPNAPLPAGQRRERSPMTVSIAGTEVRIAGATIGGDFVVVGQTMAAVAQAQSTVIFAEIGIGSVLLVVTFIGALVAGRRVGAPIELARQRQLEFTADASHELRTPLSVIEAQTSLALTQDRDPEWYRAAFQRVSDESARIRRLVDDLLWLARVDVAAQHFQAEPVEVGVLARQAADRFRAVAEARGLRLEVSSGDEPLVVLGSPDWLDRLLGVLLDNACKYAPAGGTVALSVGAGGGRVRVTVEDSGPGIPAEERSRIFDRFHRATDQAVGSGLGLAIANAVVSRTQGRWEVGTSDLGGASMVVSWPRALSPASEPARPVTAPEAQ